MKRSFRDYFISLLLAIVVFAVVGVFLIQAAEGLMTDVVTKIGSEDAPVEKVTEEGKGSGDQAGEEISGQADC